MMNDVINPFQITHPTAIQTSLVAGALFSRFDPTGRWIAAGKQNGSVVIWDLETKAPVRVLDGHVKAVTSVDWSRNARYVLTASKDWNVIVWDLASKSEPMQRFNTVRFDSPIVSAWFHPRNSKIILVLMATGEVFIVDLRKDYLGRSELCDVAEQEEGEEKEDDNQTKRVAMTVARFDTTGRYVFVGTSNGMLLVFNTRTKALVGRHKIASAGSMKSLYFTKNGRRLVTNSSDRTLRQFTVPNYHSHSHSQTSSSIPTPSSASTPANTNANTNTNTKTGYGFGSNKNKNANTNMNAVTKINEMEFEPTHRFNDPINRTAWHVMGYSPDGEWLAGGAADPATHKIYIWDLENDGQFSMALDGGREPLAHIHWHPSKALIASTTTHGNILIWHSPKAERWGAFAGGFEEVDENIEYEEREDEFDIEDEETIQERKRKREEQEIDIDGMGMDGIESSNGGGGGGGGGSGINTPAPPINSATSTKSSSSSTSKVSTNTNTNSNSNSKNKEKDGGSGGSNSGSGGINRKGGKGVGLDEDMVWADDDPDQDLKGWKMKVVKGGAEADEVGG